MVLGYSLVIEPMLSMHEELPLIPSTKKININKKL
jgi:hypothetical protein